jgi:hypothetical protein
MKFYVVVVQDRGQDAPRTTGVVYLSRREAEEAVDRLKAKGRYNSVTIRTATKQDSPWQK